MPEICRFYGIIIRMYFADHNPPHFHAYYGEYSVEIDIIRGAVIVGELPSRALALVLEWTALHRAELLALFTTAQQNQPLYKIEPLP